MAGTYLFITGEFQPNNLQSQIQKSSPALNPEPRLKQFSIEKTPAEKIKELPENTDIMKMQLASVASAFKQKIQYPIESQPLYENSWDLLHPNEFVTHSRKLSQDSEISISVDLKSYVVYESQAIELSVIINSPEETIDLHEFHAEFMNKNKSVGSLPLSISSKTSSSIVLQSNYSPGDETKFWSPEMAIKVTLNINDNDSILLANFKYSQKLVMLTDVSDSYIDNTDLVIPLNFKVNEPGRYITRANLFSKKKNTPIAHVFAKENLDSGNTQIKLSVHSSLLRDMNDAGPYELRNFDIKRLPSKPGDKTGYGYSQIEKANVNGFSLDRYSNEPYVNLQAQQRLEFLEKF